jgi:hypothetical protein
MEKSNFHYYLILATSYGTALILWYIILSRRKKLNNLKTFELSKPWLQVAGVLLSAILTILIGRLYVNGYLVPALKIGALNVSECINQILIYLPFPIFLLATRQTLNSAWLSTNDGIQRIAIGIGLSIIAVMVFVSMSQQRKVLDVILDVYHLKNTQHLIQVFMEDFAIALLLSRLAGALGKKYFIVAISAVGLLFSLGHIPNNLNEGINLTSLFLNRFIDAGLLIGVCLLLNKSKDFLWLWPIHFAMDMMQYYSGISYD